MGEILILLAAIGGSGWIVGMSAWLWHRVRLLEKTVGDAPGSVPRVELSALRAELSESQTGLMELRERVEFLERLLERKQERRQLASPDEPGAGDQP